MNQELQRSVKKIVSKTLVKPDQNIYDVLDEKVKVKDKLASAGFDRAASNLSYEIHREKEQLVNQAWIIDEQNSGRIVLDTSKIRWKEHFRRRLGTYQSQDNPKKIIRPFLIILALTQLTLLILWPWMGFLYFMCTMIVGMGSLMIINCGNIDLQRVLNPSKLYMFSIETYPFQIPVQVADILLENKENYQHFDILTYASYRDIDDMFPKSRIDPVLIGRKDSTSPYGSILAIWGTDLELIEATFLKAEK